VTLDGAWRHESRPSVSLPRTCYERPRLPETAGCPTAFPSSFVARGPSLGPEAQRSRCITATSSHLPNFRPTSRSMPTSSKPHERWSAIEAEWSPTILPMIEWNPCAMPRSTSSPVRGSDVDRVLDGGGVPGSRPVGGEARERDHLTGLLGDDYRVDAGV
jgi:hypothetical protein